VYSSILATWDNNTSPNIGYYPTDIPKSISNSKVVLSTSAYGTPGISIHSYNTDVLGTNDIIFDMFFEGTKFPSIIDVQNFQTTDSRICHISSDETGSSVYLILYGRETTYSSAMDSNLVSSVAKNVVQSGVDIRSNLTSGLNHIALGRQSGIWQVWINGTRVYRANNNNNNNMAFIPTSINNVNISVFKPYQTPFILNDIRLIPNVNLYGDSATITVPSLPLTAI
jgi:hypothetical protein